LNNITIYKRMSNLLKVSLSPHNYGKDSVNSLMRNVIIAMIPAMLVSFYLFGIGAIAVTLISIASTLGFEWLITKFILKKEPNLMDGSALITGMLLAFNVPSNLPFWIIMIGALVAIGIGKLSFGGLGTNIFNPALVGRVFLLISFPVQMTNWPIAEKSRGIFWLVNNSKETIDAYTSATPLAILKEGVKNGDKMSDIMSQLPSTFDMLMGKMGGSLGEVASIALLIGLVYMLVKKTITWHIPVSVLGTIFIVAGALWLINAEKFANPFFHLLTGGALLGAIFMATDYVTSPMTARGQIIFGVGVGLLTVIIRVAGAYPEGISFAILLMNSVTPLINMYVKPKRFGEVVKNGK